MSNIVSTRISKSPKIRTMQEIAELRSSMSHVVLLGGVFDIIHSGHINHLKSAKEQGGTLVVHVTGDERVREKKGPMRPIVGEADRASIIGSIEHVDYVFIADMPHYHQDIIDAVKPDTLYFNQEAYSPQVEEYVKGLKSNAKVIVSDLPHNKSTTQIIERIKVAFKD